MARLSTPDGRYSCQVALDGGADAGVFFEHRARDAHDLVVGAAVLVK